MGAFGASSCGGCGLQETCNGAPADDGPLRGKAMVAAAVGYFCFPLALALVGALVLDQSPSLQLIGGAGGLGLGMVIAARVARRLYRGFLRGASA